MSEVGGEVSDGGTDSALPSLWWQTFLQGGSNGVAQEEVMSLGGSGRGVGR